MTTTHSIENLGQRIEQSVAEHLAASRASAAAAVHRAFGANVQGPPKVRALKSPKNAKRRTASELAALAEQLHETVCASPGQSMDVLAAKIGASARELHRSMTMLKRSGRVRTVGQRHLTRYFPAMSGKAGGSAA